MTLKSLIHSCGLDIATAPYRLIYDSSYPLRITRAFMDKIEKGNWYDPILLQIIPRAEERINRSGFSNDPVGDIKSSPVAGLLHKYRNRVLLSVTDKCAVHCRYCFRRNILHGSNKLPSIDLPGAIRYLNGHKEINEVILSGGDPLMLSNSVLNKIWVELKKVSHLTAIRFHTRIPIVCPDRINSSLCRLLSDISRTMQCLVVIHANCAQEMDDTTVSALRKLQKQGVILLNQSVLLKGINDSVSALNKLSLRLITAGVLPYYLHQLDRARGVHHFEVSPAKGKKLVKDLRKMIAGYAVPRYVREIPGKNYKVSCS